MHLLTYKIIHAILSLLGLKTIQAQFTFSYILIALCATIGTVALYQSIESNTETVNVAGRQRMLSQRLAKEVLFYAQKLEDKKNILTTIELFEISHQRLINGDETIEQITAPHILKQLELVDGHWKTYKQSILNYINNNNKEELAKIHNLSPLVLKEMHKAVTLITNQANSHAMLYQYVALVMPLIILALVFFSRQYGLVSLMNNIHIMSSCLQRVSHGDFSQKVDIPNHLKETEIDYLFSDYNKMLSEVGSLLSQVDVSIQNVNEASQQVNQISEIAKTGANQQTSDISHFVDGLEQMNKSVQHVLQNITQTAHASEAAEQQAMDGVNIVAEAQNNINTMTQQMTITGETLTTLENDAQQVGQVLQVITGIAEQTNLLALNAAIEAARAGEQGRGFAVVADEVRTLAQHTQEATVEIRDITERLQSQSKAAVSAMNISHEQVNLSVEKTDNTTSSLQKIKISIDEINSKTKIIMTASEQQSVMSNTINEDMSKISEIAITTEQSVSKLASISQNIDAQMNEVQNLIKKFKY